MECLLDDSENIVSKLSKNELLFKKKTHKDKNFE